jgi:hypothetical protein
MHNGHTQETHRMNVMKQLHDVFLHQNRNGDKKTSPSLLTSAYTLSPPNKICWVQKNPLNARQLFSILHI